MDQLRAALSQTESRLQSVEIELDVEKRKSRTFENHVNYLKERVVALETQLDKLEEVSEMTADWAFFTAAENSFLNMVRMDVH